jgi:hypothetical protein
MTDTPDAASPSESRSDPPPGGPASPAPEGTDLDHLDEQEDESFPASDPHSDWAGPPGEIERP